jgi:chorismate synthase
VRVPAIHCHPETGRGCGTILRFFTAGESHGPALLAILEGMPAGVPCDPAEIDRQLARRQGGFGRGGRQKIERDRVQILAGVRGRETRGSPVALLVENRDWANWQGVLGVEVDPTRAAERALHRPRPGHADLAGALKYGREDLRDVLERASARETAARVAVGAVCRQLLEALGVRLASHVVELGGVAAPPAPGRAEEVAARAAASPVYCADAAASEAMVEAVRQAALARDTVGGVFEVLAEGVPVGLGSHVAYDRRLDARLAAALMSIPAIKGVEVGLGFEAARRRGSQVHDEIFWEGGRYRRGSNNAGGIEGGISNGERIVVRAAMKPIPTLIQPLRSVDMRTHEPSVAGFERSDITSVPAASVVGEAMVAFVLAQALLEKTGGDSLAEVRRNLAAYLEEVGRR